MAIEDDIKRVLSVGDLVDRYLIVQIKIRKLDASVREALREEAKALSAVIMYCTEHLSEEEQLRLGGFQDVLFGILCRQWDTLDKMRDSDSDAERGRKAVEAQDINIERVDAKNKINKLCGSFPEFKRYGNS